MIPFFVDENADWDHKLMEEYSLKTAKGAERKTAAEQVSHNLEALEEFKAWLETIGTRNVQKFTTAPKSATD